MNILSRAIVHVVASASSAICLSTALKQNEDYLRCTDDQDVWQCYNISPVDSISRKNIALARKELKRRKLI